MTQLIIMPTLQCDSHCDYCFQAKRERSMLHEDLSRVLEKLADYLDERQIGTCTIYWLGGEPLTLSPDWFLKAWDIIRAVECRRSKKFINRLQTNLMAYSKEWNHIISEMFLGEVGSSLDFPNVHRRLIGGTAGSYNAIWVEKYREARSNGIEVGVISVPNAETLKRGAAEYFSYYFEEIGLKHVHVYPPLSVRSGRSSSLGFPLDNRALGEFYRDLVEIWSDRISGNDIGITPFDQLLSYFIDRDKRHLSCEMSPNCAGKYLCCDPVGNLMQCDCWTNFPDYWFGNILSDAGFSEVMGSSSMERLKGRPGYLVRNDKCLECHYLGICHGGCPARTLGAGGDLFDRDPYCEALLVLFEAVEEASRRIEGEKLQKRRQPGESNGKEQRAEDAGLLP